MTPPAHVTITRDRRTDGSITYGLRVRVAGADERVPLGNTTEGWDEARAEVARRQQVAKMELGLWSPRGRGIGKDSDEEPTFRELATDWLEARKQNPAIASRTVDLNEWQLRRYLAPFFGELLPSQITSEKVKQYRRHTHAENARIRAAAEAETPLKDPRTGQALRTLSNESINKTLRTLAVILDEAEDAGWVPRNVARGRRTREQPERRRPRRILEVDEFHSLLEAAGQLDHERHRPATVARGAEVRRLRDDAGLEWTAIAKRVGVARSTAFYLYGLGNEPSGPIWGARRPVIATLALAGPRVTELCQLDVDDIDLSKARFFIDDAKTPAGIRDVDIHPRLLNELTGYAATRPPSAGNAPAFPTRNGTRRNKDNVRLRVIAPVVSRANDLRAAEGRPAIRAHVTPHTFRRTYITYMIAAGYDLPYVQAQVGHDDPSVTLSIYARVMRRADREGLRAEIRELLGARSEAEASDQNQRAIGLGDAPVRSFQGADLSAIVRGIER
jgi:integrase